MANPPNRGTRYVWANPELAQAMRGKRASNAAGIHQDKRTKRVRTRQASNDKAINESKEQ